MSMAFLAIVMIVAVVGINSISLKQKQAKYIAREQELQQQIDAETARSDGIGIWFSSTPLSESTRILAPSR